MSHTSGPWNYDPTISPLEVFSSDWTWAVASVGDGSESPSDDEQRKADARLIAAAPELYEALLSVLGECDEVGSPALGTCERARAAISKAEGRS